MNSYIIKCKKIVNVDEILEGAEIKIKGKRIEKIDTKIKNPKFEVDLTDKYVYPGLINAHDHLLGNYFPRVGKGPYLNWLVWDNDLKSSPVYAERSQIPPNYIYLLGAYRNIFSGVTTVSDHIPHFVNEPYLKILPVRVIRKYSLAHEVSEYDLKWGDGIDKEYKEAVEKNQPFITHVEEGEDREAQKGIDHLIEHNALSEYTVLIHGVYLSKEDIKKIAKYKAHLVWCPSSNYYMFQKTGDVKRWLEEGINVSLGTDSPMSGGLNLLEEIKFAKKLYRRIYKDEIDDRELFKMITINPAKAFRIANELGEIKEKKLADIIAITTKERNPYTALRKAQLNDISLVIIEGKPVYGDINYRALFEYTGTEYTEFKLNGKKKIAKGDPKGLIKSIRKFVKFKKIIPFFPVE